MTKNKKKVSNFFWLTGDRYLCVERKKAIISDLNSDESWIVEDLSSFDNADDFCSNFVSFDLFGTNKKICVRDGSLPEPKKTVDAILEMPKDRVLILIEDRVDKRTSLYKKMSQNLEEYHPVVVGDRVDYKKIKGASKIIKKMISWKGDDKIFDAVFSMCDYDYGRTINEIEKIYLFTDGEIGDDFDISEIVSSSNRPEVDVLVENIREGDIKSSLETLSKIYQVIDIETRFMEILGAVLESHLFMLFCKMANESGSYSPNDVGEFVSKIMQKKGKNVDAYTCSKRYYFYRDCLRERKIRDICKSISKIEQAYKNLIIKKFNVKYIFNKLIFEIA